MNTRLNSFRNTNKWNEQKKKRQSVLIGYFMAGDPEPAIALDTIQKAVSAGIDILEIGVPSLHPFLDGEVIQRAHRRVLQKNEAISEFTLSFLTKLRQAVTVPIWAMGYERELLHKDLYLQLAERQLIDGLVLPDSSVQDLRRLEKGLQDEKVDVIRFVHSQMDEQELRETVNDATIIYAQLYKGTTGSRLENTAHLKDFYNKITRFTDAKIVAGFGIRDADTARLVADAGYDGVVVGTAFVSKLEKEETDRLCHLISQMKWVV